MYFVQHRARTWNVFLERSVLCGPARQNASVHPTAKNAADSRALCAARTAFHTSHTADWKRDRVVPEINRCQSTILACVRVSSSIIKYIGKSYMTHVIYYVYLLKENNCLFRVKFLKLILRFNLCTRVYTGGCFVYNNYYH